MEGQNEPKTLFSPLFAKDLQRDVKKEMVTTCYMSAYCNHPLRFCIFAFVFLNAIYQGALAIFQRQRNEAFVISTILFQLMRLGSSVGMWKSGCAPVWYHTIEAPALKKGTWSLPPLKSSEVLKSGSRASECFFMSLFSQLAYIES